MAYTPTNWVDNVTQGNHTTLNNLETQYAQATTSFERDLFSPFVFSGLVATKDGSVANQLDVTAGIAFLVQSADSTLQRRAPVSSTQTTSALSSTYNLYLQPDGSWYWSTSNSPAANSLYIAQVTTDGSGNISTVTDKRGLNTNILSGMLGGIKQPLVSGGGPLVWWPQWDSANNRMDLDLAGQSSMGFAMIFVDATGTQRSGLDIAQDGSLGVGPNAASPFRGSVIGAQLDGLVTFSTKAGTGVPGNGTTAALAAGVALGVGVYKYVVTFTSTYGETLQNATPTSITTTTNNQDVNLSAIPTGPLGTAGRNIYRTKVGGSTFFLLHTIADNTTTTYSDTTADASLPATQPPVHPSVGSHIWRNSAGTIVGQVFSDGAISFDTGKVTTDGNGNVFAVGFQTNRGGTLTPVAIYTGTGTPSGDGVTTPQTGAIWVKA